MSETLTKKELATAIKESLCTTQSAGMDAINTVLEEIANALAQGKEVDLYGFGKFERKHLPERQGVNPLTKEKITIQASNTVRFKPAKALKTKVNE